MLKLLMSWRKPPAPPPPGPLAQEQGQSIDAAIEHVQRARLEMKEALEKLAQARRDRDEPI